MRGPLDGLLVVAFEQAVAAPFCTRHLSDMGARVIKVEVPNGGDFTRQYDAAVKGLAAHFVWLNRGKESLTLDCKAAGAAPVLGELLARADVVIQNLAPGAAARLGVDAATVVARHPRAVAVDVSGYGKGGPLEHRRAYDLLVQAEAGSCATTGLPGQPAKPGIPVADVSAGLYALTGILAALVDRERTGRGAALEVSMFDAVADLMGFALQYTMHTGEERPPVGMGSPMVAPYAAYATADDQVVVLGTTNDGEWQRLATQLLERPDLAQDPALATNAQRCVERDRIDKEIASWCAQLPLEEVRRRADAAAIGCARLNTVQNVINHDQLKQRDRWYTVDSPVGPLPVLRPAVVSSTWPTPMVGVPALGAHTDALLAELGQDEQAIRSLRESRVV